MFCYVVNVLLCCYQRLLKILEREQLHGKFDVFEAEEGKEEESGVTLCIEWGPNLF